MKTILISLTVAVAMAAAAQAQTPTLAEKGERIPDTKAIAEATAKELMRLQDLRRVETEIVAAEADLAAAEAIVKDWDEAMEGKSPNQTEREVIAINIARAKDARDRLDNLKAQAARLAPR